MARWRAVRAEPHFRDVRTSSFSNTFCCGTAGAFGEGGDSDPSLPRHPRRATARAGIVRLDETRRALTRNVTRSRH